MVDHIKAIRTEQDYDEALSEIEGLMNAAPGSPEEERLEVLAVLVSDYEKRTHPAPPPDPIDYLRHVMEARCLTPRDMEAYLGSRHRVSEVLNRRRHLSKEMIRALQKGLGLSADVLVQDYELAKAAA